MNTTHTVLINESGGYYAAGYGFSEERWVEILGIYWKPIFENEGKEVTPTMLAAAAKISWGERRQGNSVWTDWTNTSGR